MDFTTENVQQVLTFIIPGFIIAKVVSLSLVRREQSEIEFLSESFFFGAGNYCLWVYVGGYSHPLLIIFLFPIIEGFIVAKLIAWDIVRTVSGWLNIPYVNPTPLAWDSHFSEREPCWVLVTLKDGFRIGGLFGYNSFASSGTYPGDIYFECVWKLDEQGRFQERILFSNGAYVCGTEIKMIEFFEVKLNVKGAE